MTDFRLFSTLGCHLCEQAEEMLRRQEVDWQVLEIADSEALTDAYGLSIPVVQNVNSGAELNWPFSDSQLAQWLAKQKSFD